MKKEIKLQEIELAEESRQDVIAVSVQALADRMKLNNLTPEIDLSQRKITYFDVNRPALQLTGWFQHFDNTRVQILGNVEQYYIRTMEPDSVADAFRMIASRNVPCVIFSRGYQPDPRIIRACAEYQVPCLNTDEFTSDLSSEIVGWLKEQLAPRISIHGVLVDVYGEGVLIMGDSGIGKSEAAIELVKRGHRLVADDLVEVRKVSEEHLIGKAPEELKDLIELRGIGIINIRTLFGYEAVKSNQQIDLIIKLGVYDSNKEYDRLGMDEYYVTILGVRVKCHEIPMSPGRNLAVVTECAAVNSRAKKMGGEEPLSLFQELHKKYFRD